MRGDPAPCSREPPACAHGIAGGVWLRGFVGTRPCPGARGGRCSGARSLHADASEARNLEAAPVSSRFPTRPSSSFSQGACRAPRRAQRSRAVCSGRDRREPNRGGRAARVDEERHPCNVKGRLFGGSVATAGHGDSDCARWRRQAQRHGRRARHVVAKTDSEHTLRAMHCTLPCNAGGAIAGASARATDDRPVWCGCVRTADARFPIRGCVRHGVYAALADETSVCKDRCAHEFCGGGDAAASVRELS